MKKKDKTWAVLLLRNIKIVLLSLWLLYETSAGIRQRYVFTENKITGVLLEAGLYLFIFIFYFGLFFWAEKKKILKITLLIFLITILVCSSIFQYHLLTPGIILVLYYCLDGLTHLLQKKEVGESLTPFLLFLVCVLFFTPVREEPLSWEKVINAMEVCRDYVLEQVKKIQDRDKEDEFSLAMIGFNNADRERFWGKILQNPDAVLLRVKNSSYQRGDGYLTGVIRDTYTGNGFVKSQQDLGYLDEYNMNYYEILYNLYYGQVENNTQEYIGKLVRYGITYDKLATTSVFYPQNTLSIRMDKPANMREGSNINYEFQEKEAGRQYYADALFFNENHEMFLSFLRLSDQVDYPRNQSGEQMELPEQSVFAECFNNEKKEQEVTEYITSKEFADYLVQRKQKIETVDLQLPENLPERVRRLAIELTQEKEYTYDKAKAIENYL